VTISRRRFVWASVIGGFLGAWGVIVLVNEFVETFGISLGLLIVAVTPAVFAFVLGQMTGRDARDTSGVMLLAAIVCVVTTVSLLAAFVALQ
jgi:hypothetical protein